MNLCSLSYEKNFSLNWSSTSFDDLPDGLFMDILLRLPLKTLVKSTSVCRIWYTIIKSPSFISAHFSRSIADPSNYYIFLIHTYSRSPLAIVISDNHLLTRNPDLNFRFETISKTQVVIGTCNGLVCLTDYGAMYHGGDIYLINPFIHKYKKLVVESSCYANLIAQINCTNGHILVGFGYSEVENDYKVIRILRHYFGVEGIRTNKVEIYSLKSQTWKGIDASFETTPYDSPIYVQGCLYWCLVRSIPLDGHLLCFDLKDEVFSKIKLPRVFFQLCSTWNYEIFAKNGSVAVVLHMINPDDQYTCRRICLLVLENDVGGQVQWKEFYYDSVDFKPVKCLGFSVCGRLIFSTWHSPTQNMVAFDLDNSCAIEKLALDNNELDFTQAFNVMKSLALLDEL